MLIQVKYRDGTYGRIRSEDLDALIQSGDIVMFQRSSGWASIDDGPLRQNQDRVYCIPDRRAKFAYRQLLDGLEHTPPATRPSREKSGDANPD